MNQYFALSGLCNALVTFLPALYIYLKNRKNPLYRSFALFSFTVALWGGFYALWQIQTSKSPALFFMRLEMVPCYFIPFSFLWFVLTLIEHPKRRGFLWFCLLVPAFFCLFSFSDLNVKDVVPRLYFQFWPAPGILMHIFVIWECYPKITT